MTAIQAYVVIWARRARNATGALAPTNDRWETDACNTRTNGAPSREENKGNRPIQRENHAKTGKKASVKRRTREVGQTYPGTACVRVNGAQRSAKSTDSMHSGVDARMDDTTGWGFDMQAVQTYQSRAQGGHTSGRHKRVHDCDGV